MTFHFSFEFIFSKKEDWNAMVRKSTVHRNPIGSTSEALQRQRSRQSLRRHIMDSSLDGLTMNTETLLEFNPKLADVSHTTRIAYAKFMTTKIKKEIKFENDKVQVENEIIRARETKAFNKFKMNAGILKKTVEQASEAKLNDVDAPQEEPASTSAPVNEGPSKDFRARTPIEEDPFEDVQSPDRPLTPENILDEPVPQIVSPMPTPIPTSSPTSSECISPPPVEHRKADSPIVKMKSSSTPEPDAKSTTPTIKTPDLLKTDEDDEDEDEDEKEEKPKDKTVKVEKAELKVSSQLNVPSPSHRPSSPSITTGDKGKSKITGKTLTGWI